MNNTLRYILDKKRSGAMHMGIDEAVLEGVIATTSEPTLRLYGWEPATLTIGYFQSREQEADLQKCREYKIDLVRRATGGGAVLHEFEVTYSLIAPVGYCSIPEGILQSYQYICNGIILGLKHLKIEAEFVPLNDIVASGKKISGNAQTRRKSVVLQHGTILLDVDIEKMFSVLKVPDEKIRDKIIQNVKERVTGLKTLLGEEVSFERVAEVLKDGFAQALGAQMQTGELSEGELIYAEQMAQRKYSNEIWNNKR